VIPLYAVLRCLSVIAASQKVSEEMLRRRIKEKVLTLDFHMPKKVFTGKKVLNLW
jgi:hypothetical protein